MTDDDRLPNALEVAMKMPKNWGLIFRNYKNPNRYFEALEVAKICKFRRITFLIGANLKIANQLKADGVHIPEYLLKSKIINTIRNLYSKKIITTSAHNQAGVRIARTINADAVLLSPVRKTKSHPKAFIIKDHPFSAMARLNKIDIYALGGIKILDKRKFLSLGATGIAGTSIYLDRIKTAV
ncbi:MAG: hypothetical protein CMM25_06630 [Rhodospirillaceae bacterium]|nr:hypothetical protein [Rhodospirillaceae bacterium]